MKRQTKLFLSLADKLDQELEKETDLFLQERPFLKAIDTYMSKDELKEAKSENEAKIKFLVKKILML